MELTPHTFRRAFTTYHANSGMPLPLLQKLLGHSSIRTTALYWQNIYGENDTEDILIGKKWLEQSTQPFGKRGAEKLRKPEPPAEIAEPKRESNSLLTEPLPKNLDTEENFPLPIKAEQKFITPTPQPTSEISPKSPELTTKNFSPPTIKRGSEPPKNEKKFLEQLPVINQRKKPNEKENLLVEIKHLKEQLAKVQAENKKLTIKLTGSEARAKQEKARANYYEQQWNTWTFIKVRELKIIAKNLYQQYKINYYKQLEEEQEAQIEQPPKPPLWKN